MKGVEFASAADAASHTAETALDPSLFVKRPKRKVAIIFGYIGERYCGLQWNHLPDYPTVEEELLRALHRTGMISRENYEQEKVQQKLNWERASRTDKGVHALRNVLSLNVMLPYAKGSSTEYDTKEAQKLLMEFLPPDIIVYEIVLVTRSFNAYMMCGPRTYEYYLPTFAFMTHEEYARDYFPPSVAPSRPTLEEVGFLGASKHSAKETNAKGHNGCAQNEGNGHGTHNNNNENENDAQKETEARLGEKHPRSEDNNADKEKSENKTDTPDTNSNTQNNDSNSAQKFHDGLFEKMLVFHTIPEEVMRRLARYRITPERLELARKMFHLYEGTHPYHNFTPGGKSSDPSTMRYIVSVNVGDPFIVSPITDVDVLSTLDDWTPARYFSPDTDGPAGIASPQEQPEEENDGNEQKEVVTSAIDESELVQQRKTMREHMQNLYGEVGLEVVRVELHGQSFMFNQIRKMIGAVSSICAAGLPAEHLREHFMNKSIRCGIPTAPANGLFLSCLDFQRYNYRLDRIQRQGNNGEGKDGVNVDRVDEEAVQRFRRKIVAVILRSEMVGDVMGRWMRSLRHVLRLSWGTELP